MATITSLATKVSVNITDAVSGIAVIADRLADLGEKIDNVSQKIGGIATHVAKLAAGASEVGALGRAFSFLYNVLMSVLEAAMMFAAATVVVAWIEGISLAAAAGQVALGILKMELFKLLAGFALFMAIPVFLSMLATAESFNREIGEINGTLTPMQMMIEQCGEAWEKWSLLLADGTFDWFFNIIGLIALGLATIADALTVVNDLTGGWLVPLVELSVVIGSLIGMTKLFFSLWTVQKVLAVLPVIFNWLMANLGIQTSLNVATLAYISMITLGLAAVIALIVGVVAWMFSSADATDKAAEKTKTLQDATEAYKNTLKETVEEHKKMVDTINKFNEAAKSPAQKAADQQMELHKAIDEPARLQEEIAKQRVLIKEKVALIANLQDKADKEQLDEHKKRLEETRKTLKDLQDLQSKATLTDEAITARKRAIVADEMKNRGIDKYETGPTAAEELARAKAEIEAMLKKGDIDKAKRDAMLQNAQDVFEKNDKATQLAKKFADMSKTPISSFEELSKQLDSVRDKLSPTEYAVAQQKLLDDMTKGLGVEKFLDTSDTLAGRQAKLADQFSALEKLHEMGKISKEQLIAAEQKAAKEMMGQSEAGRMLQEAMEAVRPATDRLDEMYAQIDAEAAAARARGENIPEEAIEKARAMAKEKIMGKAETKDGKPHDNPALVRGSVAYVDFLRRGAGNDHMKKIRENTARQNELLAQNVETTKTVASVLNQKIEIVN